MIQIRYAKPYDYELVLKIDSSINEQKWNSWVKREQVIFAFINDELAGWLQYSFFMEKIPFVNRLYVCEKYQRQSLGTGLMKFWEFEMAERGCFNLMLSTEAENTANDFYEKLGYKVLGSFDYFGGHIELLLGKQAVPGGRCCCQAD